LLTKFSAVLVLPVLLAAVGWKIISTPDRPLHTWLRPVGTLLLALLVACGWHYARVWYVFGTPLVGNWDAASGFAWWQFPGYRTTDYYSGFGAAISQPLFSSIQSFADGIYSTLWADGLTSGSATMAFNPPWNYGVMNSASLLALASSLLLLVGLALGLIQLWRTPRAESVLFVGFLLLLGLGLTYMTLRVASYAQVKAFYGLSALLPLCVLFVTGSEWIARRSQSLRGLAVGLLLAWAGLSFASLWVRPDNPQTNVAQGIWLFDRGQFEPAAQRFQRALELDPRNSVAAPRAVETLLRLGRIPDARALAERSLHIDPENPALHLHFAAALNLTGDTNRAEIEWPEAVRTGPQDLRAWQQIALRDWRGGNPPAAVTAAREALAISPYEPTLHALLGINLATLNQMTNALWHLDYACKLKPEFAEAHAHLGRLLLAAGDASGAVPHLAIAVNANPNDLETRRNHALALQQSGQGAAALSAWRSLLQLTPEQPDLLNNLAWLLATDRDAAVRNGSEAVTLAQRACELTRRQQPALLGTLAAAHAEAGQFDEAISVAENAIALAQSNNQPAIAQRNRELLELYRARKPYYAP
jgi:Flp pilus assembly protein TadD